MILALLVFITQSQQLLEVEWLWVLALQELMLDEIFLRNDENKLHAIFYDAENVDGVDVTL